MTVLFVVAGLLYIQSLYFGWVLDDYGAFKNNIYVTKGMDGYHDILTKTYRHGAGMYTDNLYRPFSQLMFATEWQMSPNNPGLYHLMNVLFYALCCVLLFMLLKKLFVGYNIWVPFIIAFLFSVHPIHTEVVANIKGRDDLMMLFFLLLTMYFTLLYVDKKQFGWLFAVLGSFFIAFFSKESTITFLAVIPLTVYFFRKADWKQYLTIMVTLLIPTVIYLLVRQSILANYPNGTHFGVDIVDNYFYDTNFFKGLAIAIMLQGKYLIMALLPFKQVCDYSYNQLPLVNFADWRVILSLIIFLALIIYAVMQTKRKNPIAFGIWFYIITMSIFSNMVYRIGSSFADRFLFVPLLGMVIAIVMAFVQYNLSKKPKRVAVSVPKVMQNEKSKNHKHAKTIMPASVQSSKSQKHPMPALFKYVEIPILCFFVGFCCAKTVIRTSDWKSQLSLFQTDVSKSPNSAHLRYYYGLALRDTANSYDQANITETNWVKVQQNDQFYYQYIWQAIAQFKRSVEIYPKYADGYEQLGSAYDRIGVKMHQQSYRDTAEQCFLKSIRYNPTKASVRSNLGKIYFEHGKYQKAKAQYLAALSFDSLLVDAYYNLGSTYGELKQYDSSFYFFRKCVQLDPKRTEAYTYMGLNYININKPDSAVVMYDRAIAMDPKNVTSRILKTRVYFVQHQWDKAMKTIHEAITVAPFNAEAYYLRGKIEIMLNQYPAALKDMSSCIRYNRTFKEAYYEKMQLFHAMGRDDSAAVYQQMLIHL